MQCVVARLHKFICFNAPKFKETFMTWLYFLFVKCNIFNFKLHINLGFCWNSSASFTFYLKPSLPTGNFIKIPEVVLGNESWWGTDSRRPALFSHYAFFLCTPCRKLNFSLSSILNYSCMCENKARSLFDIWGLTAAKLILGFLKIWHRVVW